MVPLLRMDGSKHPATGRGGLVEILHLLAERDALRARPTHFSAHFTRCWARSEWRAMSVLEILGSLSAIAVTGYVTYWFGRRQTLEHHQRERSADAYAELLQAVADSALSSDERTRLEAVRRFLSAKTRAVIYGSNGVVEAIAAFESAGSRASTDAGRSALIELCHQMRSERHRERVTDGALVAALGL